MSKTTIPAKATTPADQSDSIVVSFGAEWHQPLMQRAFSVVIRKRVPKDNSFRWLYFHINSPVSALCGRAKIRKIVKATKEDCIALSEHIHLSAAEIASYIAADNEVGCYKLGAFELSRQTATAARISTRLVYHPPQSFFILSKQAKRIVDQFLGFAASDIAKAPRNSNS